MRNKVKHFLVILSILFVMVVAGSLVPMKVLAQEPIAFTEDEKALIKDTQLNKPIKMGVIPHTFPLSVCPPEASDYMGINVEMLSMITEKSGLQFEYCRIPLEQKTPRESLKAGEFELVAGTINLQSFLEDADLILSDRFSDGTAICIAKKNTDPNERTTGKVAVMNGYQAGFEFAKGQFPNHEIVFYENNEDVMKAVRNGKADLAMISRYVGIYELQSPFNEDLVVLSPYQKVMDSCIMGLNTPKTEMAISIINKVLSQIEDEEYNHIQMNFTITHPYKLTMTEFLFKYRYLFVVSGVLFLLFSWLISKLFYSQKEQLLLSRDYLTGAYSEAGFELQAARIISKSTQPLFIVDFDICHFGSYNEVNGKEKGNELLKNIVKTVKPFLCEQDMICRSYADNFKVLSCVGSLEKLKSDIEDANQLLSKLGENQLIFSFGIYPISDTSVPISQMLDFASIAKKSVKQNAEKFIGVFDKALHEQQMKDAKMMSLFESALEHGEFVAFYQPKFDAITQKIVGAEALVRWRRSDGTMIPPVQFIDLFERNGQIERLDFYMLEQACLFEKKLREEQKEMVPISVNFSKVHLYSSAFVDKVNEIVERFEIPKHYIEIECTETAMTYDMELTQDILGKLQSQGYEIAMDDFGKAYSSLNTLCAMPLDIIKLDSGFLVGTLENEKIRANKIIQGIITLVHDLSLKVIAEGVETKEQYLFLQSVGCDYIQGYYFSKPLPEHEFFDLLKG